MMIGFKGVPARVATLAAPPMGRQRPCALRGNVCGCSPPPRSRAAAVGPLCALCPGVGPVLLVVAAGCPCPGPGTRLPCWPGAAVPVGPLRSGGGLIARGRWPTRVKGQGPGRALLRAALADFATGPFAGFCREMQGFAVKIKGVGRWPAPRRGRSARFRAFAVLPAFGAVRSNNVNPAAFQCTLFFSP